MPLTQQHVVDLREYPNWSETLKATAKQGPAVKSLLAKSVVKGDRDSSILHDCVALMGDLLSLNPSKRVSARDAMSYEYFWRNSLVVEPHELLPLHIDGCHEASMRKAAKRR